MTTDGINYNIYDNQQYYSQSVVSSDLITESTTTSSTDNYLSVTLRSCIAGEEFLSSGQCKECSSGAYMLTPPTTI
jgi:hypothetical protein